jgi:hypothetical protein
MGEMSVSLPLDSDGFLRRECPHCNSAFKWHDGSANEEAEQQQVPTDTFFCPLCGQPAGPDSWWTAAQLVAIEAAQEMMLAHELGDAFKQLERDTRRNKFVQFEAGKIREPEPPEPITEPDDMAVVTSPCHSWEPVKVPDDHTGTLYCLVCGSAFAV